LTGQFGKTSNPFALHRVRAAVRKNGRPFADLGSIYDFDWFDPAWDPDFGRHEWADSRVLRITDKSNPAALDRVTFVNVEASAIKYAFCQAGDMLIALDIAPRGTSEGRVVGAVKPASLFVRARAEFVDGTRVTGSNDFIPSNTMETINHYVVRVSGRGLQFEVHFERRE